MQNGIRALRWPLLTIPVDLVQYGHHRKREVIMSKREIKSEADRLVAAFLKNGGRITVCAPSTRRVKTFRR